VPSAEDLKAFTRLQKGAADDSASRLVAGLPKLPPDVKKRFPSMEKYEADMQDWHEKLLIALKGGT